MTALLLLATALVAGMINAVAGGGTLLTFPALIAAGAPALTANATSTVALVPGSLSSAFAYRRELGSERRLPLALLLPSLVGGALGAQLALWSSDAGFARVAPWLILGATALFMVQEPLRRRLAPAAVPPARSGRRLVALAVVQLLVAIYGGYFGGGLGILLLASLSLSGETDLHRMNAFKSLTGACINGAGTITFIAGGRVEWALALPMIAGAIAGGYGGAGLARRIGQDNVRRLVIASGLLIGAWMLWRSFR